MEHFRRLWLAQSVSFLGDYLAMYAVQAAIVFHLRGTAREMSGVLIASLIPTAALGPLVGVYVDRWDARRTMIASDIARAVLAGALPFAGKLWHLYAISFAMSFVSAFFTPAFAGTVPRLVKPGQLVGANARMQQSLHAARIVSPAIAGVLVAGIGARACYWADSASFLISASLIGTLPGCIGRGTSRPSAGRGRSPRRNLTEGARYAAGHPGIRFATMSLAAGVFSTGCFASLVSIYVRDSLGAGVAVYGTLGTLIAAGTFTGSLFLGKFARMTDPEAWASAGFCLVGGFIALLAAVPLLGLAYAASFAIGVGAAVAMSACGALTQGQSPPEMRGRIAALSASLLSIAQGAAIFFVANTGTRFGVRAVYAFSGLLLLSLPAFRYCRR